MGATTWPDTPTFRGFDSFYGYYGCNEQYFNHTATPNVVWFLFPQCVGMDLRDGIHPAIDVAGQ